MGQKAGIKDARRRKGGKVRGERKRVREKKIESESEEKREVDDCQLFSLIKDDSFKSLRLNLLL